MFCKNCGQPIDPGASICINCGFANGAGNNYCHNCGKPVNPGAAFCTGCGFATTAAPAPNYGGAQPVAKGQKSKLVAVLLAFFLGGFGIHDFYLGYNKNGIIKIVLTVCTGVGGSIWALIDFIRLLTGSLNVDAAGIPLKNEF